MKTTVTIYSATMGVSRPTARKILNQMVADGKAKRRTVMQEVSRQVGNTTRIGVVKAHEYELIKE